MSTDERLLVSDRLFFLVQHLYFVVVSNRIHLYLQSTWLLSIAPFCLPVGNPSSRPLICPLNGDESLSSGSLLT